MIAYFPRKRTELYFALAERLRTAMVAKTLQTLGKLRAICTAKKSPCTAKRQWNPKSAQTWERTRCAQKSQRHPKDFPGGPPPQYYPGLALLNFRVRMGSGAFSAVWPLAKVLGVKNARFRCVFVVFRASFSLISSLAAIPQRIHRISSELRS